MGLLLVTLKNVSEKQQGTLDVLVCIVIDSYNNNFIFPDNLSEENNNIYIYICIKALIFVCFR